MNAIAGTADATRLTGLAWDENPFTAAGANIPTQGWLVLPCGNITLQYGPLVLHNHWSIRGCNQMSVTGQLGTVLIAGAKFPPTYAAGTVTMTAPGVNETITGTGTGWTANTTGTGNIAIGCAFVSPAGGSAINSTYGIISAITSATSITLAFGQNNGSGAPAGSTYTIYCPILLHGDGSASGQAMYSMAAVDLGLDANFTPGVIPEMDWFGQQFTYAERVELRSFCGIGLDIETDASQNSGPWDYVIAGIAPNACSSANTIDIVYRAHTGMFGITNSFVGGNSGAGTGIDLEGYGAKVSGLDAEFVNIGVDVGSPSRVCVPACPMPNLNANGANVENLHGNGTTAVQLSRSLNVVLKSIVGYSAFKNTLVDLANACTIPESVEPFLALYVTNQAHKIVVSSSAIAGCTP